MKEKEDGYAPDILDFPMLDEPLIDYSSVSWYPTLEQEAGRELPLIDSYFVSKVLPPDVRFAGDTLKVLGENGAVYAFHPQDARRQEGNALITFTRVADSEADYLQGKIYFDASKSENAHDEDIEDEG